MNIEPWDPFERFDEFRRRSNAVMDQLLEGLNEDLEDDQPISFLPEADLVETISEFRFYLSVPGIIEDDLVINVDGQHVTIRGQRRPPYDTESRTAPVQEWRYGYFQRDFELPSTIVTSTIRAACDSGVLTIVAEKCSGQPENPDRCEATDEPEWRQP